MERSTVPGERAVRDDVARLERLPSRRRAVGTSASAAPIPGPRLPARAWLALAIAALALLLALAPLSAVGDVARAFMYSGTLAAVGVCVFALVVDDDPRSPPEAFALRELTLAAALVALVASVVALAVEIAEISGRGLAGVTDAGAAAIVTHSGFCSSVLMRIAGLGLIAWAAYYAGDRWTARLFGGLGIALSCVWCALTGHEATHGFPTQLAVVLHMLAGSIWLGGLVALGVTLRARRRASDLAGGAVVVKRFSILMSSTVAVLVVAGLTLTWILVGSVGRLVTTDWGLVLCAKVALAVAVLAVARFNHRRLVPSIVARDLRGWSVLARTVAFEQTTLLAIVALTAVLVNLDPRS